VPGKDLSVSLPRQQWSVPNRSGQVILKAEALARTGTGERGVSPRRAG
jgi:hypothetical protein